METCARRPDNATDPRYELLSPASTKSSSGRLQQRRLLLTGRIARIPSAISPSVASHCPGRRSQTGAYDLAVARVAQHLLLFPSRGRIVFATVRWRRLAAAEPLSGCAHAEYRWRWNSAHRHLT